MRALSRSDRAAVLAALQDRSDARSARHFLQLAGRGRSNGRTIVAFRQRALITLALDSGLRVGELCALVLGQVLEDLEDTRTRIRSSSFLTSDQGKGGSSGPFQIPMRARRALRLYLQALRAAGWVRWHASSPVFVAQRGARGRAGHERLSVRGAQRDWLSVQRRARLGVLYNFHALRHDFATRVRAAGGDVFDLMTACRWVKVDTAQRYVHEIDAQLRAAELAERASRGENRRNTRA